jgi:four helix bundle protein
MRDFKQFEVWRKSQELVIDVYRETAQFPTAEQYGLTSQLRRAVISISANIAEGSGRASDQDFAQFLDMAMGSVAETRSHLTLTHELGYMKPEVMEHFSEKAFEVGRMLSGLSETLRNKRIARGE